MDDFTPTVADTIAELEQAGLCMRLAREHAKPFLHLPVIWNFRLKSFAGKCFHTSHIPDCIELNPKLRDEGLWAVRSTLIHELAHALEPNDDHHGCRWREACVKLGGEPRRFHSYASMQSRKRARRLVGRCSRCGVEFHRAKSFSHDLYTHKGCGGVIIRLRPKPQA